MTMVRLQRFSSLEYSEEQFGLVHGAQSKVLQVKRVPAELTIITDKGEKIIEKFERLYNCVLGESWIILPSHA